MFSKHDEIWSHLRSGVKFDSYADTRLASLYLDNGDIPPHLLVKVFDVILDPKFKLEDVTFKSFSNLLERISEFRAQAALINAGGDIIPGSTLPAKLDGDSRSSGVPTVIVSHVVDRMVKDRLPLGVASIGWSWKGAYKDNVADFHSMSLVHRSWTPIARRALRRRVVIPYNQINNFLVSPLCGPWITEMIVYWIVNNGKTGVTPGDIALFEALLRRVPSLRSLAFNTQLVWPRDEIGYGSYMSGIQPPPFHVDRCIEFMADLLPNLENLFLRHFKAEIERQTVVKHYDPVAMERTLELCPELPSLCIQLPKMRSLKFLSIRRWTGLEKGQTLVGRDKSPNSALKTIVFDNSDDDDEYRYGDEDEDEAVVLDDGKVNWLLEPRGDFKLSALSIHEWTDEISPCLLSLENLQLSVGYVGYPDILKDCTQLTKLEVLVLSEPRLGSIEFPTSLQHLAFHFHTTTLQKPVTASKYPNRELSVFIGELAEKIPSLPNLRSLTFTEPPPRSWEEFEGGELDGFIYHLPHEIRDALPETLVEICNTQDVRVSAHYAICLSDCTAAAHLTGKYF